MDLVLDKRLDYLMAQLLDRAVYCKQISIYLSCNRYSTIDHRHWSKKG